jgi:hypothetical protein
MGNTKAKDMENKKRTIGNNEKIIVIKYVRQRNTDSAKQYTTSIINLMNTEHSYTVEDRTTASER